VTASSQPTRGAEPAQEALPAQLGSNARERAYGRLQLDAARQDLGRQDLLTVEGLVELVHLGAVAAGSTVDPVGEAVSCRDAVRAGARPHDVGA
jgi:hypothetical protein